MRAQHVTQEARRRILAGLGGTLLDRHLVARRPGMLVGLGGALIAALTGMLYEQPGYMDAYYYYHVALNLAAGRGLVEAFIWNYLPPPATIVHPSNLYWMPLTSFVMAPWLALLGPSYRAAQIPFVLATGVFAAVSYRLARHLLDSAELALVAAALAVFSGYYFVYWSALDAFALFAIVVTLGLILATPPAPIARSTGPDQPHRLRDRPAVRALGAGVLAGLAHLARADGVLLLGVVSLRLGLVAARQSPTGLSRAVITDQPTDRRSSRRRRVALVRLGAVLGAISPALLGYLLVMGPWFVRNSVVAGTPLPSDGLRTLFLTEYNDLFSYARPPSLTSYLGWGLDRIVLSKLAALGQNLLVLFGMQYQLVPFAIIGLWGWRRQPIVQTFLLYAFGLYLAMSLVFTFPSGRGSMLHSSAALLPWLAAATVAGIDRAVSWVAARRPHWNPPRARRNFLIIAVLAAIALSGYLAAISAATWNDRKRQYDDLAAWLDRHAAPTARVMLVDPPGFAYSSGRLSVVTPSDGPAAADAVAQRYGIQYLALEAVHARPYASLYRGETSIDALARVGTVGDIQIYRFRNVP